MAKASEEISKYNANSGGKTDSNLANDALHLGGISAEEYATQKHVQEYHELKEKAQKQYIDNQDESMLNNAKAYADQIVAGQDFSNFAKVTDVQAVDTKLTGKINEDIANQKEYTDTEIEKVVNDTNVNFTNVEKAINDLNQGQNELFQSVSDGKSKIAGAITDKGVATSANDTFDTMAGNIRNIQSGGGGEVDPNFINTSDATASASDILVGKSAYGQGQKIYGTLIAQAETGEPTYGTDTSNATARASDIAYGKTAYARGEYIVGTMHNPDEIEELYEVNTDGYTIENQTLINVDPITGETISSREKIAYSKNLDYCVSVTTINNVNYVESYAINDSGMYIQQTSNIEGTVTTKKYRYSYEELGIEGKTIIDIALGAGGLDGDPKKCLLIFNTVEEYLLEDGETKNYKLTINLYTYHLSDNGQIGKKYENENVINIQDMILRGLSSSSCTAKAIMFNNKSNEFYVIYSSGNSDATSGGRGTIGLFAYKLSNNILTKSSPYTVSGGGVGGIGRSNQVLISDDDKYVTFLSLKGYKVAWMPTIYNDISGEEYKPTLMSLKQSSYYGGLINVKNTNLLVYGRSSYFTIYSHDIASGTLVEGNKIYHKTLLGSSNSSDICKLHSTIDGKKIIALRGYANVPSYTHCTVQIYDVETLLSLNNEDTIEPEKEFVLNTSIDIHNISRNINGNKFIIAGSEMYKIFTDLNTENLIGVKYKNEYFYKIKPNILTAGQGDVRTGKTYIGWQGYIETGTMEVE